MATIVHRGSRRHCALRVAVLAFLLAGCAASPKSGPPDTLPDDAFAPLSRCTSAWGELYAEWLASGGGVRPSLALMRQQIRSDRTSRFASLVRQAWTLQETARPALALGAWPNDPEQSVLVAHSVYLAARRVLPEDCRVPIWLTGLLWNDMVRNAAEQNRLLEAPPQMPWESPTAQQWIGYWLLVRIDGE